MTKQAPSQDQTAPGLDAQPFAVRALYETAIEHIARAQRLDPESARREFEDQLIHAESLVVELRETLEDGPEDDLGDNLLRLYMFVEGRIGCALEKHDSDYLPAATRVLEILLDAWRLIEPGSKAGGSGNETAA